MCQPENIRWYTNLKHHIHTGSNGQNCLLLLSKSHCYLRYSIPRMTSLKANHAVFSSKGVSVGTSRTSPRSNNSKTENCVYTFRIYFSTVFWQFSGISRKMSLTIIVYSSSSSSSSIFCDFISFALEKRVFSNLQQMLQFYERRKYHFSYPKQSFSLHSFLYIRRLETELSLRPLFSNNDVII